MLCQKHQQQQHSRQHRFTASSTSSIMSSSEAESSRATLDRIIEQKCKEMERVTGTGSGKSNVTHLEQWMKGELRGSCRDLYDETVAEVETEEEEEQIETWSEDMVRKRSQELNLIRLENGTSSSTIKTIEEQDELSPSRSTNTTESQV